MINQAPLLLDDLLGVKMTSMLKIKNFSKSSSGVNVKIPQYTNKTVMRI